MSLLVICHKCGARYSVKERLKGKKLKCKCGVVLPIVRDSATGDPRLGIELNRNQDTSTSLASFDEALSSALSEVSTLQQPADTSKKPRFASTAFSGGRQFKVTTAMGPHVGMMIFSVMALGVLLLANGLLLAFSVSPVLALLICVPIAVGALSYAGMACDKNKLVIEIDEKQMAVRIIKRLPWPCRDQVFPMEAIREMFVKCRRINKPLFSNAHNNDEADKLFYESSKSERVYVYDLMLGFENRRSPTRVVTFEEQSTANSLMEFAQLRRESTDAPNTRIRGIAADVFEILETMLRIR